MMIIKSDYIRDKLTYIQSKVNNDTKQKLYDINKTAEDIFMHILNDVYGWELVNANDMKPNFPAIDLIDITNEIVVQVTSDTSTKKVREDTLERFEKLVKTEGYKEYTNYKIKMFYIKEKPKFSNKTLEEFRKKGLPKSSLLGIEDINTEVSAEPKIATKVFKTLCEILHDKVCDSETPSQLTIKSSTYDSSFIGREYEINTIDAMLKDSNSLLLINGIGGIGKSSLTNHYLYTRENEFDYYGFIEGLESFISEFRNSLDLKGEKEEELYREIMFKLQNLKGNKLLVIDNVEDIESHKELMEMILSLHKYDYKILFTSRRKIKNVTAYPIGTLSLDDARELFLSYCKTDELDKVDKIINYLGLHTLFIKLVAETIESEGYSLDNILEKFENGELSKIEFIDDESGDEVTFNQNLQKLFSMQNLKDEYVLLLKRLAVLPSIDIELSFLEEVLGKERLKGKLNFLVGRGWLINKNESYKLHQIIKEFLLANYTPCFEEIKSITNNIAGIMKGNHDPLRAIENIPYLIFFENLEKIFILLNLKNREVATFFIHYGNIFRILRTYDKARRYAIQALRIRKRLFGDTRSTSIAYNNLAEIYDFLGFYKKAERLYIKALEITKKQAGEIHKDTATSYNNLGDLYRKMEFYVDSALLHNKALNIRIEIFGENNDYTASSYHNLAILYEDKKEFNKAEKFYFKALNIWENILKKNHPHIATLYRNLAILYGDQQKFQLAYYNIKKAIEILKCILPANHPQLLEHENILRVVEEKLNSQK